MLGKICQKSKYYVKNKEKAEETIDGFVKEGRKKVGEWEADQVDQMMKKKFALYGDLEYRN